MNLHDQHDQLLGNSNFGIYFQVEILKSRKILHIVGGEMVGFCSNTLYKHIQI
jgi:hypothetical protein